MIVVGIILLIWFMLAAVVAPAIGWILAGFEAEGDRFVPPVDEWAREQ